MKLCSVVLTSAIILVFAVGLSSSPAAAFDDCNCEAPDGSCSASISCAGGCIRFCGPSGNCYAECSGAYEFLGMETTLEVQNGTYPELVTKLAHLAGKQLVFSPTKPYVVFNMGFKRSPFWNALDLLSDQGTVQINGQDFEKLKRLRRILLSNERITLCVKNTRVSTFVSDMGGLTGLPLRVSSGSPTSIVNIKLPEATLDEMLAKVSEQTGTKIVEARSDVAKRPASPARSSEAKTGSFR